MAQVSSVSGVSSSASYEAGASAKSTLDKTDFLKLIAVQLQYQNPLEPMKDTEFITQLAQFTVLEQLYEMIEQQRYASFIQAQGLIGKEVTVASGEKNVTGTVEAVRLQGNDIRVQIQGQEFSWTQLVEIRDGQTGS
ncbi:MAG: flagellar hook capping FlgD N-terminal domain-containing protein [Moorellaceae bacterium]